MRGAVLLLVPACSFGARSAASSDAPAVDTRSPDAPPSIDAPSGTCLERWMAHTVRFKPPTALQEINSTGYERDPYVTPDELTIYFSSVRADSLPMGGQDVYVATRASTNDPFGAPTRFAGASTTTGNEGKMSMTGDGTQLFVASDLSGSGSRGGVDVWFAQKGANGFGALGQAKMGAVNTVGSEYDPLITPDGTALYYAPSNGLPQQIYVAKRADEGMNFGVPGELTELADPGGTGTADPAVSPDQKVILFSSTRTGSTGSNGATDIWYATRDDANGTFSAPMVVPDINTDLYDGDAHLSGDGCRVYFDSTRNTGADWDLFVAVQQ